MFDHISIGMHEFARARRFCDSAFAPLDITCPDAGEKASGYGRGAGGLRGTE